MQEYVEELREALDKATPQLLAISDSASAKSPEPGKWSSREIIGHLIDSAANNHRRFVLGQFQDDLIFPGYAGEDWVRVQRYNDAPWEELVTLWRSYNLHICRVMEAAPEEARRKVHLRHTLNEIAWQAVAEGEPTTLDYLMKDYVGHLKSHLHQILGADWERLEE
jgi:DinB superfamily